MSRARRRGVVRDRDVEREANAVTPVDRRARESRGCRRSSGRRSVPAFALACALALLAAGAVALAAPGRAWAQPANRVRAEIETTQREIDRASAALRCPPGDTGLACTYYGRAQSLQASARGSYASGFLRDALALTFRARDRASSAVRVG